MNFQELARVVQTMAETANSSFQAFRQGEGMSFQLLAETTPGRNHLVIVYGTSAEPGDWAMPLALGVKVPKGRELTAEMGTDLLRRNAQLPFGSWCLVEQDGSTWIGLRDVFMLKDVDPVWACTRLKMLANAADAFEAELGRDDY